MTRIEMGKKYRTRDGREVRLYAVDGVGKHPVHGAIYDEQSLVSGASGVGWISATWSAYGRYCWDEESPNDLIEVKPRIVREYWMNVYPWSMGTHCDTKREADKLAQGGRLACVKVTIDCEEGEGLETPAS